MMTSNQKKQILRVVEDKLIKLNPSRTGAQTVLKKGKELQVKFGEIFSELLHPILKLISEGESIILDSEDGTKTLAKAKDLFSWIDSDFNNYGTDQKGAPTKETALQVYEMNEDATFSKMFGSLDSDLTKFCLTQAQIKQFVKRHKNWLRGEGYGTFFLFESNNQFFVAYVDVHSDDALEVSVHRFENSNVWSADDRHQVVVP